jgi:hypothetical protein
MLMKLASPPENPSEPSTLQPVPLKKETVALLELAPFL